MCGLVGKPFTAHAGHQVLQHTVSLTICTHNNEHLPSSGNVPADLDTISSGRFTRFSILTDISRCCEHQFDGPMMQPRLPEQAIRHYRGTPSYGRCDRMLASVDVLSPSEAMMKKVSPPSIVPTSCSRSHSSHFSHLAFSYSTFHQSMHFAQTTPPSALGPGI